MLGGPRSSLYNRPCILCFLRSNVRAFSSSKYSLSEQTFNVRRFEVAWAKQGRNRSYYDEESEYVRDLQRLGEPTASNPASSRPRRLRGFRGESERRFSFRDETKHERKRRATFLYQVSRLPAIIANDPVINNLDISKSDLDEAIEDYTTKLRLILDGNATQTELPAWFADLVLPIRDPDRDYPSFDKLRSTFVTHAIMSNMSQIDLDRQREVANFANPSYWYPNARRLPRKFHVHVGPTNSGKTYQALSRLRQATSGVYAGPLRLLAHEVYARLCATGLRCSLITGDFRQRSDEVDEFPPFTSCTVEMTPQHILYDVAVIDEMQLLADPNRGSAWTEAILGVQAKEVHLCGEERALPLVKELVALCGDEIEVHRYERLSPLDMMPYSLYGDLKKLEKGDCLVCFQIPTIHGLRQTIEQLHGIKCAVIYGSLPPEIRTQQAALFNDPSNNYDILIASDAVGMGLNLNIRRVIFQSSIKSIGTQVFPLQVHQIKQIGGRAGRYSVASEDIKKAKPQGAVDSDPSPPAPLPPPLPSTAAQRSLVPSPDPPKIGYVGCLEQIDYARIKRGFKSDFTPISSATLFPPDFVLMQFARLFPLGTPLSFIISHFVEVVSTSSRFKVSIASDNMELADAIEPVKGLSLANKMIFLTAPMPSSRATWSKMLIREYAELVASGNEATILDIQGLDLDLLKDEYQVNAEYLKKIEALHKSIVLHMWLAYRFPANLRDLELCVHVRKLCETRIQDTLNALAFDYNVVRAKRLHREKLLIEAGKAGQQDGDGDSDNIASIEGEMELANIDDIHAPVAQSAGHAIHQKMMLQNDQIAAFESLLVEESDTDRNTHVDPERTTRGIRHLGVSNG